MFEKEALELEAEEKAKKRTKGFACQENCEKSYVMGALDFAEPREKRIAELEERIRNQAESLGVTLLEEDKKAKRIKELEKANEWHNLNENSKDLPGEDEWVEGLYIWYYKDKPQWDIFKVRWVYEIGELDEKLVCWYSSADYWHKVDEPDYWRKINLPTRNEHDRKY